MPWLIGAFTAYYFLIALGVWIGIRRIRPPDASMPEQLPFVSILVAARDEEENIEACLDSLVHQDYPPDRYEVIAIDDRSTDRTGEIIDTFAEHFSHLTAVHMSDEAIPGLTGKQRALAANYGRCRGRFVLNTDADCIAPKQWIRGMLAHFHEDTGMVIGISVCHCRRERASLFAKLQSLDLAYLFAYAIGATGWKRTVSCIGNNMAYRWQAVEELGGLAALPDSVTEDAVLSQAIEYQTDWCVEAALLPETLMTTRPVPRLRDFYHQRKRWLVGGTQTRRPEPLLLYFFYLLHIFLLSLPFLMLMAPATWIRGGGLALGTKLLVETLLSFAICRRVDRLDLLRYIAPYTFFQTLYSVVIGTSALLSQKVRWKGGLYAARRR